jgi:hypothetical protein
MLRRTQGGTEGQKDLDRLSAPAQLGV